MVSPAPCFVIAEAGVNHNGSLDLALKLVDAAADSGADAVKFQTFKAERLVSRGTPTAEYQAKNAGALDQFAMLRQLELPESAYPALVERCKRRGIEFMSTPFDIESARMLVANGMRRVKVGSGDLTSLPYLRELAALGLPVILSTGMSTLEEVAEALQALGKRELTLLHCTSNYPTLESDVNLRAMATLREAFGVPVGYSDHTQGIHVPVAAAALGAAALEKHLTLQRSLPGPDHAASLEPAEFAAMVKQVRSIGAALGSGQKVPCESELKVRDLVRRSVALKRALRKDAVIGAADVVLLRPGTGIPPRELERVLGRRAARDLEAGTLLQWKDLSP